MVGGPFLNECWAWKVYSYRLFGSTKTLDKEVSFTFDYQFYH